ncbi:response regulator transcription factor [Amedibacillus sp. YH-ame10]
MKQILIVDDEADIIAIVKRYLEREGYEIYTATNGVEALRIYKTHAIDLIITDIMMPKMDGYEFMEEVLEIEERAPFIFISAKDQEQDKIYSLMLGADDFVTKPFSPRELTLRVKNLLNRITPNTQDNEYKVEKEHIKIDKQRHQVYLYEEELILSIKEFQLLLLFLCNIGRVFSKSELYKKVWESDYMDDANTLNVHIFSLREKLDKGSMGKAYPRIQTVWGLGYRMEESR